MAQPIIDTDRMTGPRFLTLIAHPEASGGCSTKPTAAPAPGPSAAARVFVWRSERP
jgi:hypothetical protein